ncbi:DUF402 domain-containing protein [Streptoalloteichus hindustanus]|uniref:DUF402 domain-containing protein n=1 Tax=Streptoalloteichus hindustanus TaxID=2017 RepID=A0A1M5BTR0_STRHI|nr:DUF402 domain-containing protein [Streptoalloteichus hindustanus]SHF45800.1 Protein of unknown function [Streptoalloteichus hindustanus]
MSRETTTPAGGPTWRPGDEVLYRLPRLDDPLGPIHPARVVADDGRELVCWVPGGTEVVAMRLPDGKQQRDVPLHERFTTPRRAVRSQWFGGGTLRLVFEERWSSVWWFFEPDGTFRNWYVNLEIPLGRDATGVRRVDGALDVAVAPDGRWEWKDEDEAEAIVDAGLVSRAQMGLLRAEGERMIALAEAARYPFDGTWCDFRPDPAWPVPTLPEGLVPDVRTG